MIKEKEKEKKTKLEAQYQQTLLVSAMRKRLTNIR